MPTEETVEEKPGATDGAPGAGDNGSPAVESSLLDAVRAESEPLVRSLEEYRKQLSDPELSLEERLEAYEDLIDSEVGDTNFGRVRNIEREVGIRQLYCKFEGGNPTGTQKDRIAFAQAQDALRRGFDTMTLATCGNYGAAVALAASLAGLRCVIHIPDGYHTRRTAEMERSGAELVRTEGDYERSVEVSRERAEREGLYDANPGGANTTLQLQAYGEIAFEIYDDLRDAPAVVAVPVSNGTTLAGIYKGFVRLYRRGKTSRIPRMVGGSSSRKNPIVRSFVKGLLVCEDLDPAKVRETAVNEPLINWHSYDGEHALDAVRASGGWADDASDRAMQRHARMLRDKEGMNALPASTVSLAVLLERHRSEPLPADRYVVVLTGRK